MLSIQGLLHVALCTLGESTEAAPAATGYAAKNARNGVTLDELYESAGHLLRRASQINTALFMSACAEFDLTTVQFAALVAISEVPGVDVTRLSSLIAFDRSTLGGVVERLEAKGLVVRAPDKNDRRIKLLYVTPSGVAMIRASQENAMGVTDELLKPLTTADRKALTRILKIVVHLNGENLPASIRETSDVPAARSVPAKARPSRVPPRLRRGA